MLKSIKGVAIEIIITHVNAKVTRLVYHLRLIFFSFKFFRYLFLYFNFNSFKNWGWGWGGMEFYGFMFCLYDHTLI